MEGKGYSIFVQRRNFWRIRQLNVKLLRIGSLLLPEIRCENKKEAGLNRAVKDRQPVLMGWNKQ
jgi:hypothetical protein